MRLKQHRGALLNRVKALNVATQAILLIIAGAYWSVQIAGGPRYRELADNNRLRKLLIEAPRGLIQDRQGRPLVENAPSYSLYIDRTRSADLEKSLDFAAEILDQERNALAEVLEGYRRVPRFKPVLMAERLSLSQAARFDVQSLEYPEFEVEVEQIRLYRHAHQTAHLLGYQGEVSDRELAQPESPYRPGDLVGKKGVERRYEGYLRGERGEQVVVVDSRGRRIEEAQRDPAAAGRDLRLTLDLDLQQEAAIQLADKVGAIVALDPQKGEILALVSSPSFDPNRFARRLRSDEWKELLENPDHPLQNRTIQNVYPPGSVFKMVMALAALDLGLVDVNSTRSWCPGHSKIYNNTYRCWKAGGHGWVDLYRSLEGSCNVFYHQLGQKMEIDTIARYARRFGFGQRTGLDLEGEKSGLVPSQEWSLKARRTPWYPGETISVSTGQGPILVTPLQVAVMVAAIANGGYLVTPHLSREAEPPPPKPLDVRPEHLTLIREGMRRVVHGTQGTGYRAGVEDLEMAGKTGTAQVITQKRRTDNEDLPEKLRDHAWFASFAPFDDPKIVVVVFVEHGGAGSTSAAPLAKAMYEKFLDTDLAPPRAAG